MKKITTLKRILVFVLALVLTLGAFTGCGKKGSKSNGNLEVGESKYGSEYPLETGDASLTVWKPIGSAISEIGYSSFGDLPVALELEKLTGVKVEYIQPSTTNSGEQFNLMVASGELPDIIEYNWNSYSGGAKMAISDGVIIPLNDLMDAGWAPDFTALMKQYPDDVAKEAKTDEGLFFATGMIAPDRELNTTAGPIVRLDWLEELGLEKPETIDEWYEMLKAFKEKKGAEIPLSYSEQGISCGFIIGAFKTNYGFYHVNNKVMYGPVQPEFKEFLTTMKKWFDEGLLDRNFSTTDSTTTNANLINGKSGATWNALGGGIGVLTNAIKEKDPKAVFGGVPYITHKKGETPWFGQASARFGVKSAITTQCKDPELAMKWLNFGYTEAGHMLYNFGIEGVSYEWVDKDGEKYPQYTKEITANSEGLSMSQAFQLYSLAGQGGNYRQDVRYLEQYAGLPQQQDAWKTWVNTDTFDHYVPATTVADEDADEYATLSADIDSYRDEMYIKFVMGTEPLENFDKFVKTLNDMGLPRLLEIKQKAFDAYNGR